MSDPRQQRSTLLSTSEHIRRLQFVGVSEPANTDSKALSITVNPA